MFVNTLEKKNNVYEIKDYDLSLLQNIENIGKAIVIGADGLELVDMPAVEKVTGIAKVNGVYYNTLADAVAAIEVEGTIVMMADVELTEALVIPAGKTITLNLNGKTIKQEKAQDAGYSMIDNKGNLTIDSVNGGLISYEDTTEYTAAINYVSNTMLNSGVLTIKAGTIQNLSNKTVADQGYPHAIDNNGKLVIEGGTISNAYYSAIRIWCTEDTNTDVVIKNGVIINSIDMHDTNAKANKGSLTVEGGVFKVSEEGSKTAIRLLAFGTDVDEINVDIKGGTFEAPIGISNFTGKELNSKVFKVSGGDFTSDPSDYVAFGYKTFASGKKYGVSKLACNSIVAAVDNHAYTSLEEAFDAIETTGTVKLVNDVVLNDYILIPAGKEITLELNNHTIKAADDAVIKSAILIVSNGSTLVVNGEGTIYGATSTPGAVYGALQVTSKDTYDENTTAKIIVNGGNIVGDYYAIVGNGSRHNTEIVINGGNLSMLSMVGSCIFNPQNGKVTINRGSLKGVNCVEMRAGELVVNGGLLESTTAPTETNANGSGTTTTGSAVAVAQHNTKLPTSVTVNGGILKGYHALHQANPQNNDADAVALVNLAVNDGTFIAINGSSMTVYSENKEGFISGGTFVPAADAKYMA